MKIIRGNLLDETYYNGFTAGKIQNCYPKTPGKILNPLVICTSEIIIIILQN